MVDWAHADEQRALMALVCHCGNVREAAVRHAIDQGATSLQELAVACGVGVDCCGCEPTLMAMLDERAASDRSVVVRKALVRAR